MRELMLLPVEAGREPVHVRPVAFGCAGLDGCRYCMAADEAMATLPAPRTPRPRRLVSVPSSVDPTLAAIRRYQGGVR